MTYHFQCIDCDKEYKAGEVEYVCPACAKRQRPMEPLHGVLKVIFDYEGLKKRGRTLFHGQAEKGPGRFINLLPLSDVTYLPPLEVGPTPLYKRTRLAEGLGLNNLYVKDETVLPTGSLKDRASSLVVAKGRELKKDTIVCASTGNAASALAGMCASVGMNCVIFVPASAPPAKLAQIAAYGANLVPVKGTYDDAFELSLAAAKEFGWYNRNTAYNPFTIEGKKTAALEIFEQLGGRAPDKIFIPTGDGVILAGIYKGFWDLLQMGLICKLPQLIAVQAEGSSVITKMFNSIAPSPRPSPSRGEGEGGGGHAFTIADSICVSVPRNAHWAVSAVRESGGFCVTVSDKEIISAVKRFASLTGIFAEPAASAAVAGVIKMCSRRACSAHDETIVILITGSGLKDIPAAQKSVKIPPPIEPDIGRLRRLFR